MKKAMEWLKTKKRPSAGINKLQIWGKFGQRSTLGKCTIMVEVSLKTSQKQWKLFAARQSVGVHTGNHGLGISMKPDKGLISIFRRQCAGQRWLQTRVEVLMLPDWRAIIGLVTGSSRTGKRLWFGTKKPHPSVRKMLSGNSQSSRRNGKKKAAQTKSEKPICPPNPMSCIPPAGNYAAPGKSKRKRRKNGFIACRTMIFQEISPRGLRQSFVGKKRR